MSEKNENTPSDIEQIRDIIFGKQIKLFEEKIEQLEEQINRLNSELKKQREDKVSKDTISKLLLDMANTIQHKPIEDSDGKDR